MAGYPLGSADLRQHVHEVVEFALWPVNKTVLRETGYVVPDWVPDEAADLFPSRRVQWRIP